jgi:hypothetical protein
MPNDCNGFNILNRITRLIGSLRNIVSSSDMVLGSVSNVNFSFNSKIDLSR